MQLLSSEAEEKLVNQTIEIVMDVLKKFMGSKYQEQRYIRAEKLMEYTGVKSSSTIKKWKDRGLLNPIMIDGYTAYDKVEVDTMMAKHKFTTN